jgi:hypothetical protein
MLSKFCGQQFGLLTLHGKEVECEPKLELPKRVINLPEQAYELATTLIFSFVNLSI